MASLQNTTSKRLSLSTMIFAGLGLGIATGLFFGELVAFLQIVGEAWIKLLQMTVLPYVMLSMIAGLGRLNYQEALLLAKKGGLMLLLVWAVSITVVLLFPYTFPEWKSASFFSTSLIETRPAIDFLGLYIPANPFHALANNLVPAVVLFSVAIGVALIGIDGRQPLLDGMSTVIDALMRVANFVVKLTPIGVFAITASAAGTMSIDELRRLEVYIWVYVVLSLVMSLWVLPGLVVALTPLRYRDIVGSSKDALVTAFATSSLFVVLPLLVEKGKELMDRHVRDKEEAESAVEIIVPVSFNFPHAGKLFTMSFVLFAGWYSGDSVELSQYPLMISAGVASLFANVNVAVPFMLDVMKIPSDTFQLFIATSVINSRFGTLLSAMFTLTLTLLGAFSMSGLIRINAKRVIRYILITVLLLGLTIVGLRSFLSLAIDNRYQKDQIIANMQLMNNLVPEQVFVAPPPEIPALPARQNRLRIIEQRGALRACYWSDNLPFAYFNKADDLVGFDIELLHHLAYDLKVELVLVPAVRRELTRDLNRGYCDIGIGTLITPANALKAGFSVPYINLTGAFLVRDHRRGDFSSREAMQQLQAPRIAMVPQRYYAAKLRGYLPQAEMVEVASTRDFIDNWSDELDAMVTTAEGAAAWSLLHPQFSAVIPDSDTIRLPVAFPLPKGEEALEDFLKIWIDLKKKDGTIDELYRYWVLGKQDKHRQPRWSVIRDVLHWVE
jgi:Na+/H+-dicarboxylate symporter